jgi:filamentous hemagglutinin family protein
VSAQNLPTGGQVAQGSVEIGTPTDQSLAITQGSDRAVVDWQSFSIGSGHRVEITQPGADAALLNRVTGDTTSQIHGQLQANGRVFLVNPNGIFIGPTGQVDAGAFVASTLAMRPDQFMLGETVFEGEGASATVSNAGTIQVVPGGYAALIGGQVSNSGVIRAPLGKVGLASGERVTLDLSGDGFLQVAVPTESDDPALKALIENSGTIEANGGSVHIAAATARSAARQAINLGGIVEARTVSGRNGLVTLGGGGGGRVAVTGRVTTAPRVTVTSSARPQLRPGPITITGQEIALEGATLEASGARGGGEIIVGGDPRGTPDLPRADRLSVDGASRLLADAMVSGDGGRVILWSDLHTTFEGRISARGGPEGGDGGFAEVSGREILSFGGRADLRAPQGAWGQLLLDPTDVFIVATLSGDPREILASNVETQLSTGNLTIQTTPAGPDAGNIEVNAPLNWTATTELFLNPDNTAFINAPITAPSGTLRFDALGTAPITTGPGGAISVGTFYLSGGDWEQVGAPLPTFSADNFMLAPGSTFLRALGGDGSGATPYLLTDIFGLQGLGSGDMGSAAFALANDIDASGTMDWTSPSGNLGFVPILSFDGVLGGQRHSIDGLYIFQSASFGMGFAGLFETIGSGATIREVSVTGATVMGAEAGILAVNNDGLVQGVHTGGSVTAFGTAGGGIVARNFGTIRDSRSNASVGDGLDIGSPPSTGAYGGVAGVNELSGEIFTSHSQGDIFFDIPDEGAGGGVAGENRGLIEDSYAIAGVTGGSDITTNIGGLVGANGGTVNRSYAAGPVGPTGPSCCALLNEGGLVGLNLSGLTPGTVTASFWDREATGQSSSDGGGTSLTTAEMIDTDFFLAAMRAAGWDEFGTWAPPGNGDYARNYTTSPVVFFDLDDTAFLYQGDDSVPEFFVTIGGLDSFVDPIGSPAYLFGPEGDSFDVNIVTDTAAVDSFDVGIQPYGLESTFFTSDLGEEFDVVSTTALATISPAPLTIEVDDQSKVYGQTFAFLGTEFNPVGLLGVDTVDSATLTSAGAPATAQVAGSPFAIDATDFIGTGLDNYEIEVVSGELTVTPAPLTIDVLDQDKVYGDALLFDGTEFLTAGLLNADSVDSLTLASPGAAASATVAGSPYVISGSDPQGTGLGNYSVTINPGSLTVTLRPLTVTADDQSKVFGDLFTFAGTEFTTDGLVNGDSVTSATLSSSATPESAPVTDTPVAILISDPQGTGLENYEINLVEGLFTVTPAGLTITPDDQSKVYGTTFTFAGTEFTVTGLQPGDSVDSVTLTSPGAPGTATVSGSPYDITASDPQGTGLDNYTLIFGVGAFTVTPAGLTITLDDQTKVYGTTFTFAGTEFTSDPLLNQDSLDSLTIASPGAAASAQVADGPFAITGSDPLGTGLENYSITILPGAMSLTPAPLTITAEDQSKTYGEAFTFAGTEFLVEGLVDGNGDSVDSATLSSDATPGTAPVSLSPAPITLADPLGTGLENYDITLAPGSFTINPAALTITADDQSKTYGETFTFAGTEFSTVGLVNGDTVTGADLASAATAATAEATGEGFETITVANPAGTGLENYVIALEEGNFTVERRGLTVTADDQSKVQGDLFTFAGTEFSTDGLVNGDTVSSAGLFSEGAAEEALAEESPFVIEISEISGEGLENYEVALVEGSFEVREEAIPPPPIDPPVITPPPNPEDEVEIVFPGPGGQGQVGGSPSSPGLQQSQDTLEIVDQASDEFEQAVQSCGAPDQDFERFMACLSASLDTYANALDEIANDLPRGMETVAATIQTARAGVDAATVRARARLAGASSDAERQAIRRDAVNEARAAIDTAKEEIRKSISLIRAEDPAVAQVQRATVQRVVTAFDRVDTQLVRAAEL